MKVVRQGCVYMIFQDIESLPSGAPCSEVFRRFLTSSRDFSAAYTHVSFHWKGQDGPTEVRPDGTTHLAKITILAFALLHQVGQLGGQQLRRHSGGLEGWSCP